MRNNLLILKSPGCTSLFYRHCSLSRVVSITQQMLRFGHWRKVAGLLKQKAVKAQRVSLSPSYLHCQEAWGMEKMVKRTVGSSSLNSTYLYISLSQILGMLCVLLPTAVIKYPDRSNSRKRGLNLAHSSICRPLCYGSQDSSRFRLLVIFYSQSGNRKR